LLLRQIRTLKIAVGLLSIAVGLLLINSVHPLIHTQRIGVLDAERINIRESDGTLKAVLSNSAGFNEGDRAKSGGPRFSGLMFYNEEGQEEGGLIYQGKAIPGGQDSDVTLTMDQYRQDQNVYLNHTEHRDASGDNISDGLQINSRPDWTKIRDEYATYKQLDKMNDEQRDAAKLNALRQGGISTQRLFYGVRRGVKNHQPFDDAGLFIKNRLGRDAIKLYVDFDNKPHLEVYDELGQSKVYELKLSK
jgi:hypothetical protein